MDTEYLVELQVVLEPVGLPWVQVCAPGFTKSQQLTGTTSFDIRFESNAPSCSLSIVHFGKQDLDPDTAVIIKKISFFGIEDQRFVWAGNYKPDYPQHYSDKVPEIAGSTYLGWNGTWRLDFNLPVFTWIHQTLDMGWIYS